MPTEFRNFGTSNIPYDYDDDDVYPYEYFREETPEEIAERIHSNKISKLKNCNFMYAACYLLEERNEPYQFFSDMLDSFSMASLDKILPFFNKPSVIKNPKYFSEFKDLWKQDPKMADVFIDLVSSSSFFYNNPTEAVDFVKQIPSEKVSKSLMMVFKSKNFDEDLFKLVTNLACNKSGSNDYMAVLECIKSCDDNLIPAMINFVFSSLDNTQLINDLIGQNCNKSEQKIPQELIEKMKGFYKLYPKDDLLVKLAVLTGAEISLDNTNIVDHLNDLAKDLYRNIFDMINYIGKSSPKNSPEDYEKIMWATDYLLGEMYPIPSDTNFNEYVGWEYLKSIRDTLSTISPFAEFDIETFRFFLDYDNRERFNRLADNSPIVKEYPIEAARFLITNKHLYSKNSVANLFNNPNFTYQDIKNISEEPYSKDKTDYYEWVLKCLDECSDDLMPEMVTYIFSFIDQLIYDFMKQKSDESKQMIPQELMEKLPFLYKFDPFNDHLVSLAVLSGAKLSLDDTVLDMTTEESRKAAATLEQKFYLINYVSEMMKECNDTEMLFERIQSILSANSDQNLKVSYELLSANETIDNLDLFFDFLWSDPKTKEIILKYHAIPEVRDNIKDFGTNAFYFKYINQLAKFGVNSNHRIFSEHDEENENDASIEPIGSVRKNLNIYNPRTVQEKWDPYLNCFEDNNLKHFYYYNEKDNDIIGVSTDSLKIFAQALWIEDSLYWADHISDYPLYDELDFSTIFKILQANDYDNVVGQLATQLELNAMGLDKDSKDLGLIYEDIGVPEYYYPYLEQATRDVICESYQSYFNPRPQHVQINQPHEQTAQKTFVSNK